MKKTSGESMRTYNRMIQVFRGEWDSSVIKDLRTDMIAQLVDSEGWDDEDASDIVDEAIADCEEYSTPNYYNSDR